MIVEGNLNLEKLTETLLWQNDCVILPGLGALISRENHAALNPATHVIKPKSKSIFFNPTISQTDGLLANYLTEKFGVAYADAVKMIDESVNDLKQKIASGEKIKWTSLGEFFGSTEKTYFIPKTEINFDTTSYGLFPITLTPIASINASKNIQQDIELPKAAEPKVEEQVSVIDYSKTALQPDLEQPSALPAERSNLRFFKWPVAAAIIVTLVIFGIKNEDKTYVTDKATVINFNLTDEGEIENTLKDDNLTEQGSKEIQFQAIEEPSADENTWSVATNETEEPEIDLPNQTIPDVSEESSSTNAITEEIQANNEAFIEEENSIPETVEINSYPKNISDQYHIVIFKTLNKQRVDEMVESGNLYYLNIQNSFVHRVAITSAANEAELVSVIEEIKLSYPKAEIVNIKAYQKL